MPPDRITQLRIAGLRCIEDLTLDLTGLTVLIGDNGSGKSTIIEALELLRQAAEPIPFVTDIVQRKHGGFRAMVRNQAGALKLGVTIEGAGPRLTYDFEIAEAEGKPEVIVESLLSFGPSKTDSGRPVLSRRTNRTLIFDVESPPKPIDPADECRGGRPYNPGGQSLTAAQLGLDTPPTIKRVLAALKGIEIQVPFEARPIWQQRDFQNRAGLRWPMQVDAVPSVARYAENLPNCFHTLRNRGGEVWERVLGRTRLGLGPEFHDFRFPSNRGEIELELLSLREPGLPRPLKSLSEGQVAYLAFVAMGDLNSGRSILAIDEPEVHLNPGLLARVLYILQDVASECPVLLSTHSDALLDNLDDPVRTVVLCDLDPAGATKLLRPNREILADWLKDYRGIGSAIAAGYQAQVFYDGPLGPPAGDA